MPCDAFAEQRGDTSNTIQPTPHNPEPTEMPYTDNLLGSMGGLRDMLSERGVEILLEYKADFFSNRRGGLKKANGFVDNLDLRFDFDNEKLFGLKSNKAALHFTNNNGTKPGARIVGNTMGVDNIEPIKNGLIVYEAWDDQSFFDDTVSLRAGIWDLNNEFMITESSLNFLQPTMQMGQTLAQSGQNGPSTFPYTTVGARLKYH
ncbi:MAG: carbohydrate porin, partial [Rickettsiales bacterium]|nr:carbohydrate porin [Rickettsiales bacterium]